MSSAPQETPREPLQNESTGGNFVDSAILLSRYYSSFFFPLSCFCFVFVYLNFVFFFVLILGLLDKRRVRMQDGKLHLKPIAPPRSCTSNYLPISFSFHFTSFRFIFWLSFLSLIFIIYWYLCSFYCRVREVLEDTERQYEELSTASHKNGTYLAAKYRFASLSLLFLMFYVFYVFDVFDVVVFVVFGIYVRIGG